MSSVRKIEKTRDKVLASVELVCVDDNGDPHVNKGRGKKFGDIFSAQVESYSGETAVGLCHSATRLVQLFRY